MTSSLLPLPLAVPHVLAAVDPAAPPPPRDWAALVEGAGLKQRVTGKTVDGRYLGKEPEPEGPPAATTEATKAAAATLG